jgi:hypothetical protein
MKICKICRQKFKNSKGVNTHLRFSHKDWTVEKYYLTFYPIYCIECGKQTPYKKDGHYFNYKFCSRSCLKKAYTGQIPTNKGEQKYKREFLLNYLKELHKKYGGIITQKLVRLDNQINHQIYHKYFGGFTKACKLAKVPHFTWSHDIQIEPINNLITIVIDSREKQPYKFKNSIIAKLDVGDYKWKDVESNIRIERKSLQDLRGTLSNPKRFLRELDRARENNLYVIVLIDCTKEDFWVRPSFGMVNPNYIYHQIKVISAEYADVCQFVFTGSKQKSAELVTFLVTKPKELIKVTDIQNLMD